MRCDGLLSQRVGFLNARYYPATPGTRLKPLLADTRSGAGYLTAALLCVHAPCAPCCP